MTKRILALIAILAVAGLVLLLARTSGKDRREAGVSKTLVRVQFGWLPDCHHAGFWMAREKGFYAEEGLEVQLSPGGLDSSPLKAVVSGVAEIGQAGGLEQLITGRAEGLPVVAVAAFHRTSPQALISLEEHPIRSAEDLRGKKVAVAYGDAAELLFREYMARHGLTERDVTLVPFRFDLTPLMSGQVDAITGFSTDQPSTLVARGFHPYVLRYSDAGLMSYGYTFFCRDDVAQNESDVVQRFLRASRKGWEYAFRNKAEAIALMRKNFPTLDPVAEDDKFERVRALMCDSQGGLSDWGLDLAVVRAASERLRRFGTLTKEVAPESVVARDAVRK